MINRDIYLTDPSEHTLVNQGVAKVNDDQSKHALEVLRYELNTFVCEGEYAKGLALILETFLKNVEQAEQPAVWVSGFYGSGKSHLVKMLRALWVDARLPGGATARGTASLPENIRELLKELETQGRRHGGLHAASGTLAAGASGSVRLALLSIVFKSVGLPELYNVARFVLWLKQQGIYDQVRSYVEANGYDWTDELDNFAVAEGLSEALVSVKPNLFANPSSCLEALRQQFPTVNDVSNDEMTAVIKNALTKEGKFPLTLIVLDEVQQYIGEDSGRSLAVQEAVETCSKSFAGKLMFIGTGQTAVTSTANLKRLEGRFTVRVELSDTDVQSVIRKVVLAKKPTATQLVSTVMTENLGEISRHLSSTTLGHRQDDTRHFVSDYPILPVRRRFWEAALRVLDQSGTDSQLRNQLSMAHKAIQTNLDATLGSVAPADYLYFDAANRLLQASILPRRVYEDTMRWRAGSPDERLIARACGLVFLINRLSGSNTDIGIRATVDTLADLMVEDISAGSAALRSKLPGLLDGCKLLMKVGDEYRIQTEESTAWNDEYRSQVSYLNNQVQRIETEREDRIRKKFVEVVNKLALMQGDARVPRDIASVFDSMLPQDKDRKIYLWVRSGWSTEEPTVKVDALQAGNQSPTVFVFIPKRSADDLRHHLISYKAASATLDKRGNPSTADGIEARAAVETTMRTAETRINELLEEAFSGARVFQGGGNEILAGDLRSAVLEASQNAMQRLYPEFETADHNGWSKVYERAQKGAADALKAVGDMGEPINNPVCKQILSYIGGGKKGGDVRDHFQSAPYGWPQDAVDGGLQVLLVAQLIRATDEHGKAVPATELERKAISRTMFKVEATTVKATQRIEIRKLMQQAGVIAKANEESNAAPQFLETMQNLAANAGGDAPKPARPNTQALTELRLTSGNEQLVALYNQRDTLAAAITEWGRLGTQIERRWPAWEQLQRLAAHANGLEDADLILGQVRTIEAQRQLLDEPDPVAPLTKALTDLLRDALNQIASTYTDDVERGMARLQADANWQALEPEQQQQLLQTYSLGESSRPQISVQSAAAVLQTLERASLAELSSRVAAVPTRFDQVTLAAAQLLEPQAQVVYLPRRTLKTQADVDAWLQDVQALIDDALANGPVVLQ